MNPAQESTMVRFSVFELNLETGELRKHGVHVRLQEQPFRILAMLLAHPGQLVTREDIKQRLWPTDTFVDFDHSVNAAVRRLREALSDSAESPRFIETIPKRGYRFLGEVSAVEYPIQPKLPLGTPLEAPTETRRSGTTLRRIWIAAAVAILLMLVTGVVETTWRPPVKSLAVLPLRNETRDRGLDYLATGIPSRVADMLSEIETLRVVSDQSLKPLGLKTPEELAKAVDAQAVLVGTLKLSGDSLLLRLEMHNVKESRQVWGKEYQVKSSEVASLEQSIVRDLAERMKQPIPERLKKQLGSTTNAVAYEAYLRGDGMMNNRDNNNFRAARVYFQKTIDADPNFAPGYLGLGKAYGLLGAYGGMPPAEAGGYSEASFDRALEIDPDLAEAHVSKAVSLMTLHRNLAASEQELKRAQELNPNLPSLHGALAELYVRQGRLTEAAAAAQRATELDPYTGVYACMRVGILGHAKKIVEVDEQRAHNPAKNAHLLDADAYASAGRKKEALAELAQTKLDDAQSPQTFCEYAQALGMAGEPAEARKVLERGLALQKKLGASGARACTPFFSGLAYAAVGDREKMYEGLEEAERMLDPRIEYIRTETVLDPYRGEERFQKLMEKAFTPR